MTDNLKQIAVHYGRQAQMVKCVEELNELAVALLHNDYDNIVEEMADVEIMLAQVKFLMGIPDGVVSEIMWNKIVRQQARLEGGNEK